MKTKLFSIAKNDLYSRQERLIFVDMPSDGSHELPSGDTDETTKFPIREDEKLLPGGVNESEKLEAPHEKVVKVTERNMQYLRKKYDDVIGLPVNGTPSRGIPKQGNQRNVPRFVPSRPFNTSELEKNLVDSVDAAADTVNINPANAVTQNMVADPISSQTVGENEDVQMSKSERLAIQKVMSHMDGINEAVENKVMKLAEIEDRENELQAERDKNKTPEELENGYKTIKMYKNLIAQNFDEDGELKVIGDIEKAKEIFAKNIMGKTIEEFRKFLNRDFNGDDGIALSKFGNLFDTERMINDYKKLAEEGDSDPSRAFEPIYRVIKDRFPKIMENILVDYINGKNKEKVSDIRRYFFQEMMPRVTKTLEHPENLFTGFSKGKLVGIIVQIMSKSKTNKQLDEVK